MAKTDRERIKKEREKARIEAKKHYEDEIKELREKVSILSKYYSEYDVLKKENRKLSSEVEVLSRKLSESKEIISSLQLKHGISDSEITSIKTSIGIREAVKPLVDVMLNVAASGSFFDKE